MAVVQFHRSTAAPLLWLWLLLFGVYALGLLGSALMGQRSRSFQLLLIVLETLAVIGLAAIPHRGDPGPLLAPVALQAALLLGTQPALKWVALQSCLIWLSRFAHLPDPEAWLYWALNVAAEL